MSESYLSLIKHQETYPYSYLFKLIINSNTKSKYAKLNKQEQTNNKNKFHHDETWWKFNGAGLPVHVYNM